MRLLASLCLSLLLTATASAQPSPLPLTRISSPLVLDGMPDEEAWQQVPPLPLTMYAPVFRGEPTQRTEIRVAYDDEFLYVAGRFYDTNPSGIRINSLYRDRWNGDDTLAIYVDGFNDNRNAKWFGITPAGMRFDQLVSDDGATLNENWDGFWSASTRVTAEGWFVEVRIPFSTIGFHADGDGRAVMGLTVTRLISRLNERVTFPAIDPRFEFRRPSVAQDVVLEGVHSRTPLYVTPYALAGANRTTAPAGIGVSNTTSTQKDVGLDVRYPMSGTLTLDLTVNTDFAQVEADEQQVALDRFPLFYPERRRFFQEGSGLFDFTSSGGGRLFHSRRIGLAPDGTTVPILGGARLVGRAGGWDVAGLDMQTDAAAGRPGENFGVLRLRHPVLNRWSTAGLMVTTFSGGRHQNVAIGADTTLRPAGDHYLDLKWAATFDDRGGPRPSVTDRSLFDARWQRRTNRGLSYTLQYTRAGDRFEPELGFMPRENVTTANASGNYYIFTDTHRVLKRVYPGALAFSTVRNADGTLESGQYAVWVQWDTKAGGGGWVEPKAFHENVLVPFTIGGAVTIPAGSYDFADLQLHATMAQGRKLRTDVDARSGSYFDGTRTQVILTPTWNVSRHLELGADYQLTALRFPIRDEATNIQLARVRVRTAANARASANAFVQYNSTTDRVDLNLRLRYTVAEGTDLWIVYNEGLDTEPETRFEYTQPRSIARALIVKYTHTFGF